MRQNESLSQYSNLNTQIINMETQKMKPLVAVIIREVRDCEEITNYDLRITINKSEIVNPKSEIKKSCSSVWLEHYTDNVGVSSSNLLGTTAQRSCAGFRG